MTIRNFLAQARTRDRPTQRGEYACEHRPRLACFAKVRQNTANPANPDTTRHGRVEEDGCDHRSSRSSWPRRLWLLPNNCGRSSIDRLVWRRPPDPPRVPVQVYRGLQVSCDLLRQPVEPSWALPDSSQPARFRDLASGMRRGHPRQPDHRQPKWCNQRQRHSNPSARGKKAKCNISISSATYGKRDT